MYEGVCESQGADSLSHQRVLDLLKEWAFSDVTEHYHTGGGKNERSYEHSLLRDPDMVLETVFEEEKRGDIVDYLGD